MMPGSKGQKAVRACTIKLLTLGPAKHEKVAIYAVNQRIPNAPDCESSVAAEQSVALSYELVYEIPRKLVNPWTFRCNRLRN